jgi:microsomal dipeptidase-like Zn-dependent dipeptidase
MNTSFKISFTSILLLMSISSFARPVKGFADLHVHMFANLGFAGSWFVGDPTVATKEKLFTFCKEEKEWPWLKGFISKMDPYVSSFLYRNHCIPKDVSFPQWNDLAHQQVWANDLKSAHKKGLNLIILSAVHSYVLCKMLPDSRKNFHTCEDKPNLLRQLNKAKEFIKDKDWIELALSPKQAREIIEKGKMAVILSIEASNLFDNDDWAEEFQAYWDAGIRTLGLVHQFDNKIAGSAIHKPPLKLAHYLRNYMRYDKLEGFDSKEVEYKTKFGTRKVELNKKGLTKFGESFIKFLMERGLPIDFAHMSEKTMKDVQVILRPNQYPFYISHGHFRDAMKDGLGRFEKSSSLEILKELKHAHGIFGMRTITFGTHKVDKDIQNNCDGSSLSFAHAYQFGKELGINIAFGSDFNGFISQVRPRFSKTNKDYCPNQKVPGLGKDFDHTGLGKMDQLPHLVEELKNLGVNLKSLENSAEKYIQVWERSYSKRKTIDH